MLSAVLKNQEHWQNSIGYDIITSLAPCNLNDMSLEESINKYNVILLSTLDKHAPLKTKTVKIKNTIPYFNDEIRQEIQTCRRLEWVWRKDHSNTAKFLTSYHQRRVVVNMLDNAEQSYYHTNLQVHSRDFKQIFRLFNGLLGRNSDLPLPQTSSDQDLADHFNKFFTSKLKKSAELSLKVIANLHHRAQHPLGNFKQTY